MTCSSSTTSTPEPRLRWRVALAALALASAPVAAQQAGGAQDEIAQARSFLARGDGIAAERKLARAIELGAARSSVAAYMGEALLDQGELSRARQWLGPGAFDRGTAGTGWRLLGILERREGNPAAAARAFDRALAVAPRDGTLWVEIGRLRYAAGEHAAAVAAAEQAVAFDPANVRALEFRGQLVRDQYGLAAALPWFEAALFRAPDDLALLGDYAATLGDLGRAREMLAVTRRMIELDPKNARAFFLQAVLAARAGDTGLARAMLARTRGQLAGEPAALLLEGVLELRAGNPVTAVAAFEQLASSQPANMRAQVLLARAMVAAGEHRGVVDRFGGLAERPDAPAYLRALVARSHEVLGSRDRAAALLDRAARMRPVATPVAGSEVGGLLAAGRLGDARVLVARDIARAPGSASANGLAGDIALSEGRAADAAQLYARASAIKRPEGLLLRQAYALERSGNAAAVPLLVETYLAQTPTSRTGARLVAQFAAQAGQWKRARRLLEALRKGGGGQDVSLLADLAFAQLRDGDARAAADTARAAHALQPSNALAAEVWGLALKARDEDAARSAALLARSRG